MIFWGKKINKHRERPTSFSQMCTIPWQRSRIFGNSSGLYPISCSFLECLYSQLSSGYARTTCSLRHTMRFELFTSPRDTSCKQAPDMRYANLLRFNGEQLNEHKYSPSHDSYTNAVLNEEVSVCGVRAGA